MFIGMINSACLFNAVLILTVVTQRMSTIYLNQGVQSLSAVTWFKQTLYHRTQNGLRLFATSTQENPAGAGLKVHPYRKPILTSSVPKWELVHFFSAYLLLHFSISLKRFLVFHFSAFFLRTPRHLPTSSGQLSCLHNSADGFAPVTDD